MRHTPRLFPLKPIALLATALLAPLPSFAADADLRITELASWEAESYGWVALNGNQLYATNSCAAKNAVRSDALDIWDISDTAAPQLTASLATDECWEILGRSGNTLYLFAHIYDDLGGEPGLRVMDVSDPSAPDLLADFSTDEFWLAATEDETLFLLRYPDQLEIIDLSDPQQPASLGTYTIPDYDSPASSSDLASGSGPYTRMDVEQGRLYLIGPKGARVVNVSDLDSPVLEGKMAVAAYIEGLQVSGGYAYVAEGSTGFEVLDVRNSDDIASIGYLGLTSLGVEVEGDYAWIANASGLHAVDIGSPDDPTRLEDYDSDYVVNFSLEDDLVAVAEYPDRLTLLRAEPLLTVKLSGTGTVTDGSGALTCSKSQCTGYLPLSETVSLTPAAGSGYYFSGWSGDCSGNDSPLNLRMSRTHSCTANFKKGKPPSYTLKMKIKGKGSVASTPSGIACPSDCKEKYTAGTEVILTATPATGQVFSGWSGSCYGTSNPLTLTLSASANCKATFKSE